MAICRVLVVVFLAGFIAILHHTSPSYAAGIWARVSGKVIGSSIRFDGWVNFSLLTRKGKATGKLNDGSGCRGISWINIRFSHGGGNLKCRNGLSAIFKFTLSSRYPIRGMGNGTLADGRKLSLKISPGE